MSTTRTEQTTPSEEPTNPTSTPASDSPAPDEPLGEGGLRALQAERERGNRMESELRELRTVRAQMDALRAAFGVQGVPEEDPMGTLQRQVATMLQDNLVNSVARRHGITEEADVDLLRSAPDEAAMARLAERLRATAAPNIPAPNAPAPDPLQGAQPPSQEALEEALYAHFYPNPK